MSAAFWLSSSQAQRDKFDITVYTRGWRLGGKGASGRNAAIANRIEEHGLHMWMGCYANAFRTLKDCYAAWQPAPGSPFTSMDDAFTPQFQVTLEQLSGSGSDLQWHPWNFVFPPRAGRTGDPALGIPALIDELARRLTDHLQDNIAPFGQIGDFTTALNILVSAAQPAANPALADAAIAMLTPIAAAVRFALGALQTVEAAIMAFGGASASAQMLDLERNLIIADLGLTIAIGVASDILPDPVHGFDNINGLDFRAWLSGHGATQASVDSAVIRGLYDLGFAYPDGDSSNFSNGRGAAGVALRFVLEFALDYKGAPLWKMNAGMGDTVFTPLYQVLLARGVKFNFFSRLADIGLSADASRVEKITLQQQAELLASPYRPLVKVKGLDCWPSEPDWTQLVNGAALKAQNANFESHLDTHVTRQIRLRADHEFDAVVLAIPPAMLQAVAPALSVKSEWQSMLANSSAVATQAFQLWLKPTLLQLGWQQGPTVLTAYASPFDTWADMTHLGPAESWTGPNIPGSVAYFCGAMVLPNPLPPDAACTLIVQQNAENWLKRNISAIWPGAGQPGQGVDPSFIVSQYSRCNSDPSELYVQTLPGSVRFRLAPGGRIFSNLYLAGDWTLTRYSSGCVEAAIESGMLASQALSGIPASVAGH